MPSRAVQLVVVNVREDVLVPLGLVPVDGHLRRAAVRPTHVGMVDRLSERPRQEPGDVGIVDPAEPDVERDAIHGNGSVSRQDEAHPRAVDRVQVVRQLVARYTSTRTVIIKDLEHGA